MVYEIHSLLGDEVERDRLGRGLVFRTYLALEEQVVPARGGDHRAGRAGQGGGRRGEGRARPIGCSVIYPGIDLGEYDAPGPPASIPGIGPEHKVIMYVGSIVHPNQGVPILIEALPRVFASAPEARCVLVGGPAEAGETLPCPARPVRRPADRPDRPDPRSGRCADPARRRAWSIPGSPAARTIRSRARSPSTSPRAARSWPPTSATTGTLLGDTGAGLLTPVGPEPAGRGNPRGPDRPRPGGPPRRRDAAPSPQEYFAMDRNIDRYLDVYQRAIATGPR